jgi:hypothetical protein
MGLLRFAVKVAVRSAVHSHLDARRQQQEALARGQQAGPFAFSVTPDGETGGLVDRRTGFGHAFPGFPRPLPPPHAPGEPACEAMIGLCEVPVAIRYRLDRPQMLAANAADFAGRLAHAYIGGRTHAGAAIGFARIDQLQSWRVEAAALAQYPLPQPDGFGADFEELLVQVAQGFAMTITIRYPREFRDADWLRKALLTSALYASPIWDPHRAPHHVPQIWPPSSFLTPGLSAQLLPHPAAMVATIAPSMPTAPGEREALSASLGAIIAHDAPPWHALAPAERAQHTAVLCGCSGNPAFHAVVQQGLGEVRTMHDLRGFAIMIGRALSPS